MAYFYTGWFVCVSIHSAVIGGMFFKLIDQIAKEAKDCVQECVSEFVSFITSEYPFYVFCLFFLFALSLCECHAMSLLSAHSVMQSRL